jgi:hypothetical protein
MLPAAQLQTSAANAAAQVALRGSVRAHVQNKTSRRSAALESAHQVALEGVASK